MCTGIFSMEVCDWLKIWFFIPNHLRISLLIVLWRNSHNMNDAKIAFQICMNDLFCFGESNSEGEEHTGQMRPPLRQGEERKMTPLSCRAMSAAGNISLFHFPPRWGWGCQQSLFHVDAGSGSGLPIVGVLYSWDTHSWGLEVGRNNTSSEFYPLASGLLAPKPHRHQAELHQELVLVLTLIFQS